MDGMDDTIGGGFLNESITSSGDKKTARRAQNVVPVMIAQILRSSGDMKMWGIQVHMVSLVGLLRKVEEATTKVSYEIEDDTGTITGHRWLEANKNVAEQPLELNTYCRVYGLPRDQNGTKQIFILDISPIEDLNELTNHFLEVTCMALKAEKDIKGDKVNSSSSDNNTMFNDCTGMSEEQATVFKMIQAANNTDCGIERSEIKSRVPKSILPRVDGIIDFLTSEGHIYTTFTDDHFKTT